MATIKRPTERQYNQRQLELLAGWAPEVTACKKCGWPVLHGYCCGTCGDRNPQWTVAQEQAWEQKHAR